MIIDWSLPFSIVSPYATISVNADPLGYAFVPELCVAKYAVRSSKDPIPQADGSILHRRFKTGYEIALTIELWTSKDTIACDDDVTEMGVELDGVLSSLLNAGDNEGRLIWTPSGAGTFPGPRMFDDVRLLVEPVSNQQAQGAIRVQFVLDTQYPYAIDQTQQAISTTDGTETIEMEGNTDFWPVFQVYAGASPMSTFSIANDTTGEALVYSGTAIAAGDYLEIDCFRNTAFVNGDGASRIDGFDPELSDFFPLVPGENLINCSGMDELVTLVNNAWA